MRMIFAIVATLGAVFAIPHAAQAQYAPWCATYSTRGGQESCGFASFAQCQVSVSGIGGFCYRNPWHHAYADPYLRKKRHKRHYR